MMEQTKNAATIMYNDPQLREKVRRAYTGLDHRLPSGVKPEHTAALLAFVFLVIIWQLGVVRTIFVLSFILLVGSVALPDILSGASAKVIARNFPHRWKENLVKTTGLSWITDKMALGCLILLLLFVGKTLITPSGSNRVTPKYSSSTLDLENSLQSTTDPIPSMANQWTIDDIYKMGFDDATEGLKYGDSLANIPSDISITHAPPQRTASSFSHNDDVNWNNIPESKKSKFGFGSAMALFAIGRVIKDMGFTSDGRFDVQLLSANVKNMEPWKAGLFMLAIYRVISVFF